MINTSYGNDNVTGNISIQVLDENNSVLCNVVQARYADNWAANLCQDFADGLYRFLAPSGTVRIRIGVLNASSDDWYVDSIHMGEDADYWNSNHYGIELGYQSKNLTGLT